MTRSHSLVAVVTFVSLLVCGSPPAFTSELAVQTIDISFDGTAVRATGITPGSSAVAFSVSRVSRGYDSIVRRTDTIAADEDGDGRVTFQLDAPVAFDSVWIVVDMTTGFSGSAAPSGIVQPMTMRERLPAISVDAGALNRLTVRSSLAELLLVRPGVGAWRARAFEGGRRDADGVRDGVIVFDIGHFVAIGSSPPQPTQILAGDVVIAIDSHRMELASVRTGAGEGVR